MGCYGFFFFFFFFYFYAKLFCCAWASRERCCWWVASRTDRDSKNARNENRNEMNAKSEFAPGRSERWRHPEPRQAAWAAGRQASRQQAAGGGEGTQHPGKWRLHGHRQTPISQLYRGYGGIERRARESISTPWHDLSQKKTNKQKKLFDRCFSFWCDDFRVDCVKASDLIRSRNIIIVSHQSVTEIWKLCVHYYLLLCKTNTSNLQWTNFSINWCVQITNIQAIM